MTVCRALQDVANILVTLSPLKDAKVKDVNVKVEGIWGFFTLFLFHSPPEHGNSKWFFFFPWKKTYFKLSFI